MTISQQKKISFQCGSALILVILPPFPATLAMVTHFVILWFLYLILGTLAALGLTRVYLILKVIKFQGRNSYGSILQPTEFIQLDHERHFKLVLGGLLTATAIYVLSALVFSHLFEAGANIFSTGNCMHTLVFQESLHSSHFSLVKRAQIPI